MSPSRNLEKSEHPMLTHLDCRVKNTLLSVYKRRDPTLKGTAARGDYRYLVLNYEAFQQPDSAQRLPAPIERELIDFVIVDEIH
jgi:hypothetical protein